MARELWVGPGREYARLSDAVADSAAGDTIKILAGEYRDDFAIIRHPVTITGVGGKAHLKAVHAPDNGKAVLVVNADVSIDHLEFSGAHVPDQNGAGIRHQAGDLTIRNSVFHDNEMGIFTVADHDLDLTVSHSSFLNNGRGDGKTHALYANQIGSLTVSDSRFEGTDVGHHIKSRALKTTIEDSEFRDNDHGTASYNIDLPNGGIGVIRGNTIVQGPDNSNRTMISFGAEGPGANNSLLVEGNHFINEHPERATGIRNFTDAVVVLDGNVFDHVERPVDGPFREVVSDRPEPTPEPAPEPEPAPVVGGEAPARPVPDGEVVDGVDNGAPEPGPTAPSFPDYAALLASGAAFEGALDRLGSAHSDTLAGSNGNDRLRGGDGNDILSGGAGDDLLGGGGGNDLLLASAGQDALLGGPGNDWLLGGSDADVFVFGSQWGQDRLANFQNGLDRLDFRGSGLDFADMRITDTDAGTQIAAGADSLTLQQVAAHQVTESDFIFG